MKEILKAADISKFITALKFADYARSAVYAAVIALTALNVLKIIKAYAK